MTDLKRALWEKLVSTIDWRANLREYMLDVECQASPLFVPMDVKLVERELQIVREIEALDIEPLPVKGPITDPRRLLPKGRP